MPRGILRKRGLTILLATVLVDMIGFGIVLPLLPFYAESFGASPLEVTLIIASFSAMQLLAAPVWGRFSDRHGRRPLIVAGLFASAVSYLIFGLAGSLGVLLLSRVAAGAAGGTISVAQAYVADSTAGEERAHGMGLIGAAAGLGVMLGPAIGGYFSRFGLGMPGYVAAGLCLANGVAALFFLPESGYFQDRGSTPEAGSESAGAPVEGAGERGEAASLGGWIRALLRYPLSLLLTVYFLSISSFAAMTSVLALYLERVFLMDAADMGVVFTLTGAMTVIVRGGLLGRIVHWLGENVTVRFGGLLLVLVLAGIPLMPTRWWLGLVIPGWALATGTLFPSLASLVSRASDVHSQGSVLGGSQFVGGLGRVVGPVWAGWLFQHVSLASPFYAGAVLVALAFVLALRIPAASSLGEAGASEAGAPGGVEAPAG